jgi:MarR family transcriptional regulator, organic hydroperoxide resistance regulator
MAKTGPHMRRDNAAAANNVSPTATPPADEAFPPPTISLETFVKSGSDCEFRQLIFELTRLFNLMQHHSDEFARYIGTNNAQFYVIMLLAQTPDLTVSQIAQFMSVTSQFVTIEIGKLIRKGIVEKRQNASDRRSSFLNLTSKGKNLVRELAPVLRRANNLQFRSLTEERLRTLKEIIHAIVEDGRHVIYELESPDIRNATAPSAQQEPETRHVAPRPADKLDACS